MYVFLNTLPKSGSAYIWQHMVDVLGLPPMRISENDFPNDRVIPEQLRAFKQGAFTQEHMDASVANMAQLEAEDITKIFIHLRDPRQAALSWHFHIAEVMARGPDLDEWRRRNLPEGYANMDNATRLDRHRSLSGDDPLDLRMG